MVIASTAKTRKPAWRRTKVMQGIGRRRHCLLTTFAPRSPAGPDEQHQQQDDEGDGVLVAGGDDPDPQRLHDAEQKPTGDRAERVAEPTERRGREALEAEERPRVIAHEADGRDHHPRGGRDEPGEREAEHDHPVVRDALHARGRRVDGAGPHRLAEQGAAVEHLQRDHDDDGEADDPQRLREPTSLRRP